MAQTEKTALKKSFEFVMKLTGWKNLISLDKIRQILAKDINKLLIKTSTSSPAQRVLYGFERLKKKDHDMRQSFVWILL